MTEDWSNCCWKFSFAITEIHFLFKYIKRENCYLKFSKYYCFYYVLVKKWHPQNILQIVLFSIVVFLLIFYVIKCIYTSIPQNYTMCDSSVFVEKFNQGKRIWYLCSVYRELYTLYRDPVKAQLLSFILLLSLYLSLYLYLSLTICAFPTRLKLQRSLDELSTRSTHFYSCIIVTNWPILFLSALQFWKWGTSWLTIRSARWQPLSIHHCLSC